MKVLIPLPLGGERLFHASGRIAHCDQSRGLERLFAFATASIRSAPCLLTAPPLRRAPLPHGGGVGGEAVWSGSAFSFHVAKIRHFCGAAKYGVLWRVKICEHVVHDAVCSIVAL